MTWFDFYPPKPRLRRRQPKGSRKAFVVRVDLVGAKPPIWRRLALASDMTFEQVHVAIQRAMGWEQCHLHAFELWSADRRRFDAGQLLCRFCMEDGEQSGIAEWEVELSQVLARPGDKVRYTYDFGDGWDHNIVLEKVMPWEPEAPLVRCLAGRRACPPEDCGGLGGYYDLLDYLAGTAEESEVFEIYAEGWLEDFDPEEFDLEDINASLESEEKRGFLDTTF